MKAFLLAAGAGTRLRPLTEKVPKCLVPIGGKPLLAYWLDLLCLHGVDAVLVNTHHLHDQVFDFFEKTRTPLRVTLTYEPQLLGSAGTLQANCRFVDGDEDFFIVYADNLTNADLTTLWAAHKRTKRIATIALFRAEVPQECGIVTLDDEGVVIEFQEKPRQPRSNLAFAGIMVASSAIFRYLPDKIPCDLGSDVLNKLVGRMGGQELNMYLRDIGTAESLERAQTEVRALRFETR